MALSMFSQSTQSPVVAYLQSYFVTIATILGTGILGLPVMLTRAGIYPFLISFLLNAVMQSVLIHLFTDLLQRACAVEIENCNQTDESVPLYDAVERQVLVLPENSGEALSAEPDLATMKGKKRQSTNLHMLGKLFLRCGFQHMFDAVIILQFISLLISYALAGSEAYAELIGINHFYVIPVFVWVLTLFIVFALGLIQPIVSILTFIKGSVLLATTLVTFYVGLTVGRSIHNDFSSIGSPFLMATVALGGTINTMPLTYEKIQYDKKQIANYRLAVHLGLWTCVVLNILWCWAVLDIVPQTVEDDCLENSAISFTSSFLRSNESTSTAAGICYGEMSLESAKSKGEISTIPLTKILARDHPKYTWVAVLVEVFIMISITVSYLTIGGALHHTLTGIVQSVLVSRMLVLENSQRKCCNKQKLLTYSISIVAFSVVFAVAMSNPQGFVDILEKFVSFILNVQAGFFIFMMLLASSKIHCEILLPLTPWMHHLKWTLPLFFGSAVIVDIYNTVRDFIHPQHIIPIYTNLTSKRHLP